MTGQPFALPALDGIPPVPGDKPNPLTARKVAELLAMHMVGRDIACILPEQFNQGEVFSHADERSKQLIQHFEDHRRHLLEAIGQEHPEVLDAI